MDWDNTQNLYIEGDNLEVLKLLQKSYLGKVKMIYIDPPYNTGNDFVYHDDFAMSADEYAEASGSVDELGNKYIKNMDSNGRFHSDWCSMMYSRLMVARTLLTEDGVIFISIDDNEVKNLRNVADEIFGPSNFGGTIIWKKKTNGNNVGLIPPVHDYIVVYTKEITKVCEVGFENNDTSAYSNPDNDKRGPWKTMDLSANHKGPYFGITNPLTGETFFPSDGRYWVFNEKEVEKRIKEGRIIFGKTGKSRPVQRVFLSERENKKRKAESWWDKMGMNEDATTELKELFGVAKVFSHPKPTELLFNLCSIVLAPNDIVLDFFSGSASTAHALFKLNQKDNGKRKFILVQLAENLDANLKVVDNSETAYTEASIKFLDEINKPHYLTEIAKERIRRAGKKIKEESPLTTQDLDTGFRVLKLDSTNMQDIYYSPKDISQADLFSQVDNVKPDRTGEDLLFQVMLELGATLNSKIETTTVAGKTIYNVAEGYLVACFDPDVTDDVVKSIAQMQPAYAVLRDTSMKDDSTATNFEQIFKTYSPDTVTKIL